MYVRIGCAGLGSLKTAGNYTALTVSPPSHTTPRPVRPQPTERVVVASDAALQKPREGSGGFHIDLVLETEPKKISPSRFIVVLHGLVSRASQLRNCRGVSCIDTVAALMPHNVFDQGQL